MPWKFSELELDEEFTFPDGVVIYRKLSDNTALYLSDGLNITLGVAPNEEVWRVGELPPITSTPRPSGAVLCNKHSESKWCFVQPDGTHVPLEACLCGDKPNLYCPVTAHYNKYILEAE